MKSVLPARYSTMAQLWVALFLSVYATLFLTKGDLVNIPAWLVYGFALAGVILHGYRVLPGFLSGPRWLFNLIISIVNSAVHAVAAVAAAFVAGNLILRQGLHTG